MNQLPAELQLIPLFNAGFDYARKVDGEYVGANKKYATHVLCCTRWNTEIRFSDPKKRLRASRQRPVGYALAVAAIPLRRRKHRTTLKLKKPVQNPERILYIKRGPLAGKRQILIAMTRTHATPEKMRRMILKMSNAKCDALYRSILTANKVVRRKEARARRRALRKLG